MRSDNLNITFKMNTPTQIEYQLEAEYKRWEILLSTLKNENEFLMLQLSQVLDGKVDKQFILKAEYFQNEFIAKDENIKDMINDIKAELRLIYNTKDKLPVKNLLKHEKLKNEIKYFERNFSSLKTEFGKSVSKG